MVWLHGPFPCSVWSDINIFKSRTLDALDNDETVISENGYQHEMCTTPNTVIPEDKQLVQRIRVRHETCIARFAISGTLQQTFHHDVSFHGVMFHAVAKITHLTIRHDCFLFFPYKDYNFNVSPT